MGDNDGCLTWIGLLACIIIALYVWFNNVDTIVIKEQIPPPQDSWEVVYPRFRDDVSSQLLNTQELVGIVLEDASYIKSQNSDVQYSLDLLLNELGIIQQKSEEESRRQRFEQWLATGLSIVLGWLFAIFVPTKETLTKIRNIFFKKSKRDSSEHQGSNKSSDKTKYANTSLWELIQIDPADRVLVVIVFILGIAGVILFFLGYYVL